jgi:hypothetical protein
MSFARSCGSLITSCGPRTAPNRYVEAAEDLIPMRHRLSTENFVKNGRQLRHVFHQLLRIRKPWICEEVLAAIACATAFSLSGPMISTNQVSSAAR